MNKTKIEWVKNPDGTQGFSCNPFSGLCPVGCWYCWGKGYVKRFEDEKIMFWMHRLDKIRKRKKPAGIFLCSKFELFHPWTKGFYRNAIFGTIEACPQHRFYILTKYPQNIDRPMPDNVWLGVTVTKSTDNSRLAFLKSAKAQIKFVSYEPILREAGIGMLWYCQVPMKEKIDWLIMGRLTGKDSKLFKPRKQSIQFYVKQAKEHNIPIFLKDNLKDIWQEQLIQEWPRE